MRAFRLLATFIRRKRLTLGLSLQQVTQRMGGHVDASTIHRWEHDTRPSLENACKLATALKVRPEVFVEIINLEEILEGIEAPPVPDADTRARVDTGLKEWHAGRHMEACRYFGDALRETALPEQSRCSKEAYLIQLGLAFSVGKLGKLRLAYDLVGDALELAQTPSQRIQGYLVLSQIQRDLGHLELASAHATYAATIASAYPDEVDSRQHTIVLMQRAVVGTQRVETAAIRGGIDAAVREQLLEADGLLEEAVLRFREDGDAYHEALAISNQGWVRSHLSLSDSEALLESAVRKAETHGFARVYAIALSNRGWLAFNARNFQKARLLLVRAENSLPPGGHDDLRFHNWFYRFRMAQLEGDKREENHRASRLDEMEKTIERWIPEREVYPHFRGGAVHAEVPSADRVAGSSRSQSFALGDAHHSGLRPGVEGHR